MPLLVADCPRCGAKAHTFDVLAHVLVEMRHGWQTFHEVFSVCRNCRVPTDFLISLSLKGRQQFHNRSDAITKSPGAIMGVDGSLNVLFEVERFISLRDHSSIKPPEHLPPPIDEAFKEGAACFTIGCYNAAACMFRLSLDLASRPLLPDPADTSVAQPDNRQRRELGRRLAWLFDAGVLPTALKELAKSVREDGNDGAHAGTLSKDDAMDLLEFTEAFLERLITEPKKLELAEVRRKERREKKND